MTVNHHIALPMKSVASSFPKHLAATMLLCALILSPAVAAHAAGSASAAVKIGSLYYSLDASARTATVERESSSENYAGLRRAEIPASVDYGGESFKVTAIGVMAFGGCSSLEGVVIPASVSVVDTYAFEKCGALKEVVIEDSPTPLKFEISPLADQVVAAFADSPLESVYMGRNISYITSSITETWAPFYGQTQLRSLEFGPDVTTIGNSLFFGSTALAEMELPPRLKEIGSYAFHSSGLTSLRIPDSVTYIAAYAFFGCRAMRSLKLGNQVESIMESAFEQCVAIESLVIPDSVRFINFLAFCNCVSVRSLTLGNSLRTVMPRAFLYCPLEKLECRAIAPPKADAPGLFSDDTYALCPLEVPAGSEEAYRESEYCWSRFSRIVPQGNAAIGGPEAPQAGSITARDGRIFFEGFPPGTEAKIYRMDGSTAYSGPATESVLLPPGLYIATAGSQTAKIALR